MSQSATPTPASSFAVVGGRDFEEQRQPLLHKEGMSRFHAYAVPTITIIIINNVLSQHSYLAVCLLPITHTTTHSLSLTHTIHHNNGSTGKYHTCSFVGIVGNQPPSGCIISCCDTTRSSVDRADVPTLGAESMDGVDIIQ